MLCIALRRTLSRCMNPHYSAPGFDTLPIRLPHACNNHTGPTLSGKIPEPLQRLSLEDVCIPDSGTGVPDPSIFVQFGDLSQVPSTDYTSLVTLIYLGTSAFTAAGWEKAFYPAGMKPTDYLTCYSTKFQTVEIDSTFYGSPSVSTVEGWKNKTPETFIIAAKVPQEITHEECFLEW